MKRFIHFDHKMQIMDKNICIQEGKWKSEDVFMQLKCIFCEKLWVVVCVFKCFLYFFIMLWTEGEIQGTIHRRLLEDRAEELKVGAVLLLKQVRHTAHNHITIVLYLSYTVVTNQFLTSVNRWVCFPPPIVTITWM